jgi:hydrogenase maturation protein HypF
MTILEPAARGACRITVRGVVQGVGFRPFVHRLALRHHLEGWVRNASGEVQVALEGETAAIEEFLSDLHLQAPILAQIDDVHVEPVAPEGLNGFAIEASAEEPGRRLPVPPDVAICPACELELNDPGNRRYRYPFITCTDCGPRYTVIERLPYDRERTTMRAFAQCPACAAEYHSPGDRRHHSETNSCALCGPTLWLEAGAEGRCSAEGELAIRQAGALLQQGGILAVRGFGGYHLACDATNEASVAELRRRKRREAKPFAIMLASLTEVRAVAEVSEAEAELLQRRERPVVLLEGLPHNGIAASVAPGLGTLGVMLPSTPLHLLLIGASGRPLVMTSGNLTDEPIAIGNTEARRRLGVIADAFLMHDREILSRCDDSVLRMTAAGPIFLRRARGYAPLPLTLPVATPVPLLAVGPHLKNTFTVAHGGSAWVSPHIGDLEDLEGMEHFRHTLSVYRRLFRVDPEAVVHDLHPGYLSTRLAQEMGLPRTLAVQHHHAHIAAVMAEHGVTEPVIGVAYDGTGYGTDGTVWGAEILRADLTSSVRVSHLRPAPLPGGDLAARQPWRCLLGYVSLDPATEPLFEGSFSAVPPAELALARRQLEARINSPLASSMGRLFDAAAAVLGIRQRSAYEGQAAIELEALAGNRVGSEFHCPMQAEGAESWQLDPLPLLAWLARRHEQRGNVRELAADFHESIARLTEMLVRRAVDQTGLTTVALGGGVFQNARLLTSLRWRLEHHGLRVLVPRRLSPNDGAISYGQAAVAAALLQTGLTA